MKNIVLILVAFFVLIGCAPKKEVVIDNKSIEKPKEIEVVKEENKEIEVELETKFIERLIQEEDIEEVKNLHKIAVIYPSRVVGKYAKSTISTISAFLIYHDMPFKIETFDTYDENPENILEQLNFLEEQGFTKVIAMFTSNGFNTLNSTQSNSQTKFYFPLINKSEVISQNNNFIFGGISYSNQLRVLQSLSDDDNTMFYVKSYLGSKLREIYENTFTNPGIIKEIERTNNRYKYILNDDRIIGDTVVLNTPIVKTSIILSQLTAFEVEPKKVLSTQLNYNPLLVKLTQERDRKNFYVVSAISEVDSFLEEYTKILGANVSYNWVDYSSLVGANYLLFNEDKKEDEPFLIIMDKEENFKTPLHKEIVKTKIIENQADYESILYKTTPYGFSKIELN